MDFFDQGTRPKYLLDKIDNNNIGETGCNYLSEASMEGLQHINIGALIAK